MSGSGGAATTADDGSAHAEDAQAEQRDRARLGNRALDEGPRADEHARVGNDTVPVSFFHPKVHIHAKLADSAASPGQLRGTASVPS